MRTDMYIPFQSNSDDNNLNNTNGAGEHVNENKVCVFKNQLDQFGENFEDANKTIQKHRTVNIFSHNPKNKTGLSRFKQILDNIGHNIAVLFRREGNVIEVENELNNKITKLNDIARNFKEDDYKNFLKNDEFTLCIEKLKKYEEQLAILYGYSTVLSKNNDDLNVVKGTLRDGKKRTIEKLKCNFRTWFNIVKTPPPIPTKY